MRQIQFYIGANILKHGSPNSLVIDVLLVFRLTAAIYVFAVLQEAFCIALCGNVHGVRLDPKDP